MRRRRASKRQPLSAIGEDQIRVQNRSLGKDMHTLLCNVDPHSLCVQIIHLAFSRTCPAALLE